MLLYNALGEIGMSKDLEDLSIALFNGELPAMWRRMTSQVLYNLFLEFCN
jgi:hypothetical protein